MLSTVNKRNAICIVPKEKSWKYREVYSTTIEPHINLVYP